MSAKFDLSLYLVIGPENCPMGELENTVGAAIKGGVTLVQYRNKHDNLTKQIKDVKALLHITKEAGIPLIVNDHIAVAQEAEAQGVHLGQDDDRIEAARRILGPEAIIGLTVKKPTHLVSAPYELLDYVGIGGVFPTKSKVNPDAPLGVAGLKDMVVLLREISDLPATAIAGIDPSNCQNVLASGVDGVAVVSAIAGAQDPEDAAKIFSEIIKKSRQES